MTTLPPIEAEQPCFRCNRTGPLVVDRFPQQPTLRDHPERFMHASGICPEPPQQPDTHTFRSPAGQRCNMPINGPGGIKPCGRIEADPVHTQQPARLVFAIPDCPPAVTHVTYEDNDGAEHTACLVTEGIYDGLWQVDGDTGGYCTWIQLLARGALTDATPPREVRVWPKLDGPPDIEDPPTAVDLFEPNRSPLRFVRTTGARGSTRYIEPGHPLPSFTLTELREHGDVREVLTDGK